MAQAELKKTIHTFEAFSKSAAHYLHITDDQHYEESLALIEWLLEEVGDDEHNPKNILINIISNAVSDYERRMPDVQEFEAAAYKGPADIAMLRLLMDQHNLTGADFPEIGDKSLVSRIFNGKGRNLTKTHITKLSERFGIDPALFFDRQGPLLKRA